MHKTSLVSGVVVPVGQAQVRALQQIEVWDFSEEANRVKKDLVSLGMKPTDQYIERGIDALRRYHAIAALDPRNGHAIADVLDPFWHVQILFTKNYMRFCDTVLGEYMHHDPLNHSDVAKVGRVCELYEYTREVHRRLFGQDDEEFYPVATNPERVVCFHYTCDSYETPLVMEAKLPKRPEFAIAA